MGTNGILEHKFLSVTAHRTLPTANSGQLVQVNVDGVCAWDASVRGMQGCGVQGCGMQGDQLCSANQLA